jgi:signal transduction histidine kinase
MKASAPAIDLRIGTATGLAAVTVAMAGGGIALQVAVRRPWFGVALLAFLAFPAMGLLIVRNRPANLVGWLLLWIGLNVYPVLLYEDYAGYALVLHPGSLPAGEFAVWLGTWIWAPFVLSIILLLPMLFPDGRLLSRRWWLVMAIGAVYAVLAVVGNALLPGSSSTQYPQLMNPYGSSRLAGFAQALITLSAVLAVITLIGSGASMVVRYRRGDAQLRHQLRWFLFAMALAIIPFVLNQTNNVIVQFLSIPLVSLVPISIAIAILRYRLYDIDVVISRTLTYGALAVFITVVYVGVVAGVGTVVGSAGKPNLALSILATALVAVAFQPVRQWLQRFANRIVYGRRASPYEVMAAFARGMAGVLSVDDILPRMAEAAAGGVGAKASRVRLKLPTGEKVVDWPSDSASASVDRVMPVAYHGEPIGEIAVTMPPGGSLTSADDALLKDLASQAGLAMHNARLTFELEGRLREISAQAEQLQISRNRIVSAEGTERRRLEENIQAGVYRELTTLAADLRATDAMLLNEPLAAAARLDLLAEACNRTLEKLRDLARGIYPPLLRDQGLVPALRAQLAKLAIQADVVANGVGRYPEEVEAAVYFACVEALAGATHAVAIRLTADGSRLAFTVEGVELPPSRAQDIEDRVESLGGHLHHNGQIGLAAELPLSQEAAEAVAQAASRRSGSNFDLGM